METTLAIKTDNPFVLALQSTKLSEMKKGDATKELIDILVKTYYDAGQVMPGSSQQIQKENLQILAGALLEETKQFKFLRIEEIKIAFKNGVRGEYGDWFGINIKTFYQWIKGYQFDEKRKNALQAIKEANQVEYKPVMSESEAEYEWKQTIIRQFTEFKQGKPFHCAFPTQLFTHYEKSGAIKLTDAEKKAIYEKAKLEVLEKKKQLRLNPKNKMHLGELCDFIRRAEDNTLRSNEQNEIKQHARIICIKNYYNSIEKLEL